MCHAVKSARRLGQPSVFMIVVADPCHKRENYQDHENRARGWGWWGRERAGGGWRGWAGGVSGRRGRWRGGCGGGGAGGLLPAGAVDGDVVDAVVEHETEALQVRHRLGGLAPD